MSQQEEPLSQSTEARLDAALAALGGSRRDGQVAMAQAVTRALENERHLAVQAGTGTGKSLAYLVPSIRHAQATGTAVIISTATIALQRQLVERDLPRLADALEPVMERRPTFAILKGRSNYVCLNRIGAAEDPEDALLDEAAATSPASTNGPRRPGPGTATTWSLACRIWRGGRCRSPHANASVPPAAPTARSASRRRRGGRRTRWTSW